MNSYSVVSWLRVDVLKMYMNGSPLMHYHVFFCRNGSPVHFIYIFIYLLA